MFIIAVNPMMSHVLPTLALAQEIKKRNEEVLYIGEEKTRSWIEGKGFKFRNIESGEDSKLKKFKKMHKYPELEVGYKNFHQELFRVLEDFSPDDTFLFPISRFDSYFIPAHKAGVRAIAYTASNGSVYASHRIPPSTSLHIPTQYDSLIVMSLWARRFIRKYHSLKWNKLKHYYPYDRYRSLSDETGYGRAFTIDGFCLRIPVICLGPSELEFGNERDVLFAGLCLQEEYETREHNQRKMIYCSFGTMSNRYLKRDRYIVNLVEILRRHPEWDLIISIGDEESRVPIIDCPENVKVFGFVDQKTVLKNADLAITHGGYGSIKECIYYETPMIVSPSSYDQAGNAARVHFKGIGKKNTLLKKSFVEKIIGKDVFRMGGKILEKQMVEILSDDKYLNRIIEMKERILEQEELLRLVDMLIDVKER